jgi:cyclic pyranopterin phosphate synthase
MVMNSKRLTHVDAHGSVRMVDVGKKADSVRIATAAAKVRCTPAAIAQIRAKTAKKGDVLATVRVAAILAAKRTHDLLPLCHPLALSSIEVDIEVKKSGVLVSVTVQTTGPTGVEMEALTAATVGALTLYDMLKSVDRGMEVSAWLTHKSGGRSGTYRKSPPPLK